MIVEKTGLSRRAALLIALAAGLLAGIGYPLVDLALSCRVPDSEACVWGKAYLPLSFALSVVIVGGAIAGLLYAVLARRGREP